jgi:hypothetical protein
MIDLGNGIELYTDDELPKVLTIEELKEFAQKKPYQPKNADILKFEKNEENGLLYTNVIRTWANDFISHFLMEICIQDMDKYDWVRMTDYFDYRRIADYVYVWLTPYTWMEDDDVELYGYLVEGRVAKPEYNKFRKDEVYKWAINMLNERELILGDHIISMQYDYEFEKGKVLAGMNFWSLLTTNPRKYIQFVFENGRYPVDEEMEGKITYFDNEYFLNNMRSIAEEKGPEKAARVVRALRKDWKPIVNFKLFNIDKITPEQIEEFRAGLFEGMDYYLELWDAETPQPYDPSTTPASFEYITDQCRKEGKAEAVEAELRAAAKGTAVAMWKTIRTNEALGYLSTKNLAASKIYKALTAYFGPLPYNERNFRDARNKR